MIYQRLSIDIDLTISSKAKAPREGRLLLTEFMLMLPRVQNAKRIPRTTKGSQGKN
jgi:hypothetical protein